MSRTATPDAPTSPAPLTLSEHDITRFWSYVVKGPRETSCWLWIAAIGDDGYGRFWVGTPDGQRVLRPHRIAYSLAAGVPVDLAPVVEHLVCDNPICVRADGTLLDHLEGSTQAANLAHIDRRSGDRGYRGRVLGREAMHRRSRALRAAVIDGWSDDRIEVALAGLDERQMTLF